MQKSLGTDLGTKIKLKDKGVILAGSPVAF